MNVFKKFAAMTLASAVVLGTLAGCGSSGGDTAAAGSGAAAGGATKDISEISVGVSLGTLKQERWAREAEMFQQYADDNGFSIDI